MSPPNARALHVDLPRRAHALDAHLRRDIGLPERDRADALASRILTALMPW